MTIAAAVYPIPIPDQITLIQLWRTEWDKTELDWLAAMNGDYSQTLAIHSVIGTVDGQAAGTTTVYHAVEEPEVALVGSVLTHPDYRSLGIATHLTNGIVDLGFDAGCQVCFLAATRSPKSVYLRCGFGWWNGDVMRRPAPGSDDCESKIFAPDQRTAIREAVWGDMPGMTCLVIQPLDCFVLDYARALHSGKYSRLGWCVSNFPAVWYNVKENDFGKERGGAMCVLTGAHAHRVLGFATLTPGRDPCRGHKAVIDLATHDNYEHCGPDLLDFIFSQAAGCHVETVQAYVAGRDNVKLQWLQNAGFEPVVTLPGQVFIDGEMIDVVVLERRVAES